MNPNQISIRLDEDLIQKLDSEKGQKNRASYVREIIESHERIQKENNELQTKLNESQTKLNESQMKLNELQMELAKADKIANEKSESNDSLVQTLQGEIEYLKKQFDTLNQEKLELLRLLNQSQILQMQAQKQLTEAQEIKNKTLKWWQFWKK